MAENKKDAGLTETSKRWLLQLAAGDNPNLYLHGRSAHGGASATRNALFIRGLIDGKGAITAEGRKVAQVLSSVGR